MKIAQIAPLYESVPPLTYGGTERVVSYLTEALIDLGHEVTLFASGDSLTRARLRAQVPRALRMAGCLDPVARHLTMIENVLAEADDFDLIHAHVDYLGFALARRSPVPVLTTLHGRLDLDDVAPLYRKFDDIPLTSISNAQRKPVPDMNWLATVHHGLPLNLYAYNPLPEPYLAFVGRVSPEKRLDVAIEIAKQAGLKLKIASKIDKVDESFFRAQIQPLLNHPLLEFIGEIGEDRKGELMGRATALLAPIDWPEPFGLVFIEAMACGTPVITRPLGAAPEIITHGENGFLVDSTQAAVEAVRNIGAISRLRCRQIFVQRFNAQRMAHDYLKIYRHLVHSREQAAHRTSRKKPLPLLWSKPASGPLRSGGRPEG